MNKIAIGVLVGAILGIFDGATAWFMPAVRAAIVGIIIGSCIKGMIAGAAAGWFARRVQSVAWGIVFGLIVGALLAFGVAQMQHGYYLEIILPGSLVGAIVGWATQRYGRPAGTQAVQQSV
jgi:F0F1-type ATP synthase assembly protein I